MEKKDIMLNMMTNKKTPRYLVRPRDFHIFEIDESNDCYRSFINKNVTRSDGTRPNAQKHFTFDNLVNGYDFFPIDETQLDYYISKNREYLDYMKWYTRPDGHGGIKGGTMDEYTVLKNITKEI